MRRSNTISRPYRRPEDYAYTLFKKRLHLRLLLLPHLRRLRFLPEIMADANAFFKAGEKDDLTFSVASTQLDERGNPIYLTLVSSSFQLFIGPNTPMVTPIDFSSPVQPLVDAKGPGLSLKVRTTLDTAGFPAGRYKGVFKIVDDTSKDYLFTYLIWVSDPKG